MGEKDSILKRIETAAEGLSADRSLAIEQAEELIQSLNERWLCILLDALGNVRNLARVGDFEHIQPGEWLELIAQLPQEQQAIVELIEAYATDKPYSQELLDEATRELSPQELEVDRLAWEAESKPGPGTEEEIARLNALAQELCYKKPETEDRDVPPARPEGKLGWDRRRWRQP